MYVCRFQSFVLTFGNFWGNLEISGFWLRHFSNSITFARHSVLQQSKNITIFIVLFKQ